MPSVAERLNYLGTCEMKSRTAMAKAAFNKWKIPTHNTNTQCYLSDDQKGTESMVGEKGQDIK
jgi:hypothetical protein